MLVTSSRGSVTTTTTTDPIRALTGSPRRNLQPGPNRTITRTDSTHKRGNNGGKVSQTGAAKAIKDIRRATRKQYSAEEKIRIVLDGLRGEETIAELCRREGIAQSIYYKWSKEFLEAGKRRLAGDTARAASTGEVTALRREARELKEVVAEQTLELRLLKKSMIADGGDDE